MLPVAQPSLANASAELGFALHLPHFILHEQGFKKWIHNTIFVTRLVCNAIGATILAIAPALYAVAWTALAISIVLHLLSFFVHRFIVKPPIDARLYRIAHLSITNFIFDTPGRGIKEVRFSHALIVYLSIIPILVLAFTWATITPIERAWSCYDPAFITGYESYKYGYCDGGAICARPQIDCTRKAVIFGREVHFFVQMFAVLFAIHLAAVPAKIDHYELKETLINSKKN